MTLPSLLEALDGLMAKATPGEWLLWDLDASVVIDSAGTRVATASGGIAHSRANAALIAELHQSYPALRAALAEGEQMREALTELESACLMWARIHNLMDTGEGANCADVSAAKQAVNAARVKARRALALKEET